MKLALRIANAALLVAILLVVYNLASGGARGRERFPGGVSQEFIRGDANDDTAINLSDAVYLLRYLFSSGEKPPCLAAADTDDDGQLVLGDAVAVLQYLFRDGPPPASPFPEAGIDPSPDLGCREPALPPLPAVGSEGGPDRDLSDEEALSWRRGRQFFDAPAAVDGGLGPLFNGDSCRGCHLDPVVGGAGGLDVDVVRFAYVDGEGTVSQLQGGPAVSRHSIADVRRDEKHAEANLIETRQTPTLLGLGLVDRIPDAVLIAGADPDDVDGDGITGRVRMVGGRPGRFGHKCGVPSLKDFAADALLNELGLTVDPAHSPFAGAADGDGVTDPEVTDRDFLDLTFFISHLAPPTRAIPDDPLRRQRIEDGEALFGTLGCDSCHTPQLEGEDGPVRAYSDFLLHDVADPARHHVNEEGVEPAEFRTAPLWGLRDTAPYLHDGSAESIQDAILGGHHGEAAAARQAFEKLSFNERAKVEEFLESL